MSGAEDTVGRAAVLGAGVMGAQIAAHLANAGVETLLFELPGEAGDAAGPARRAREGLIRQQPAPLATAGHAARIHPANYRDDLSALAGCDLVVEAVAERLEVKREVFARVAPYLPAGVMVGSNTSGLSVNAIASVLPRALRAGFCGIHFFNPPRYMHLVELTPTSATDPAVLDTLETFLTTGLGKGVVRARDTPNFIANRLGVFSMMATVHHAAALGIPPDTVDALTGRLIGRPRSATFRTLDLVGLDTLRHVVEGAAPRLADDPWVGILRLPDWLHGLIDTGALGAKSGAGVYRRDKGGFHVFDPAAGDYRENAPAVAAAVRALLDEPDPGERLRGLRGSDHPQARFLWAIHRDLFHYAAHWLQAIADTAREADLAVRWGFGWQQGPFEQWQAAGWRATADAVSEDIAAGDALATVPLPDWVARVDAVHRPEGSWSAADGAYYRAPRELAVYRRQRVPETVLGGPEPPAGETTYSDGAVRLWHLDPDVGVLSFATRRHVIDSAVLDGVLAALEVAESRYRAVVLWQDSEPFSVGADLREVMRFLDAGDFTALERMVARFQAATGRLRAARVPVVAAVRGMALGGGCEFVMHCDHVVAAQESYLGLVEAGVGLIPGGGGCRLLAARAAEGADDGDPFPRIRAAFETVAKARVAGSANEARDLGLLEPRATVVMHAGEVLHVAMAHARALAESGYRPPLAGAVRVAGRNGLATLRGLLVNMAEGGYVSAHDRAVAERAAAALCGGDVETGLDVDGDWLLRLERDGFMALLRTDATRARIAHMLETGKPLRN